ncbi:unnamed protein product [Notodromas monacha]|uniref:Major facilitator superfamily (MFS) profile domain-containing protein n=1 Tax=Notodromas monacha TaxID=399045 RepID=A0A7R9BV20_9CRUS|nr:unnamed protein product [Notodromas monacha]CAG0922252.1 unnamed protein product [Notodromas monacha]
MTAVCGPKSILTIILLPTIASWLMVALGNTCTLFFISRTILGICGGIAMPIGQTYLAEISSPKTRGFISSTSILAAMTFGLLESIAACLVSWRALAWTNAALVMLHLPFAFFSPESPVWLLKNDADEAAKRGLQFIRRTKHVDAELKDIKSHISDTEEQAAGNSSDLLHWTYLKPVLLLLVFMALRQFSGAFVVISYTVIIFESVGHGILDPKVSTVILYSVQLLLNLMSNGLTDTIGRKKLIIASSLIMTASHISFGTFYYLNELDFSKMRPYNWVPLISLIGFFVGFSIGFASIPFVFMTELLPLRIRSCGSSLISFWNNILSFIVVQFYHRMKTEMTDAGLFWFYGSVCLFAALFCALCLPETKGICLRQLERELSKKSTSTLTS